MREALGGCDEGLVVDLSPINYTRVDPAGGYCSRRGVAALGVRWTMQRTFSVWQCPAASFQPPASADSIQVADSAT